MAGKEVIGIENACADLFDSASMVITSDSSTDARALDAVRVLTRDMGFKYVVECHGGSPRQKNSLYFTACPRGVKRIRQGRRT